MINRVIVKNNPLKYTDPSGHGFGSFLKRLWRGTRKFFKSQAKSIVRSWTAPFSNPKQAAIQAASYFLPPAIRNLTQRFEGTRFYDIINRAANALSKAGRSYGTFSTKSSVRSGGHSNQNSAGNSPTLIEGVKVYRKDIDLFGGDKYGHWWIEIGNKESYGWWPKGRVGFKGTLFGVDGELNGQTNFRGTATLDPHHGDRSAGVKAFNVYSTQSKAEVVSGIRNFANSYGGNWSWPCGQNCHSFQEGLLGALNLTIKAVP